MELSVEGAEFRGEGNSGLVCALKSGDVLKLKKISYSEDDSNPPNDWISLHKYQVKFIRNVALPLFGSSIVDIPKIVQLREEDIAYLSNLTRKDRAAHRLKKRLSATLRCGLLLPDYCLIKRTAQLNHIPVDGPVICVELKPKMGFLPNSISPRHQLKSLICRFHLVQERKLRQGRIEETSGYCPLDLFSGCPERMECAILELLHNPQNNLRIFCDRRQVFGAEITDNLLDLDGFLTRDKGARDLSKLIRLALSFPLKEDRCKEATIGGVRPESRKCTFATKCRCKKGTKHQLTEGSVLWRILQCQQLSLDDATKTYESFYQNHREEDFFQGEFPKPFIPENYSSEFRVPHESDEEFSNRMIWKFLVALTSRDCSVMLTMQRIATDYEINPSTDSGLNILEFKGDRYLLSIGIVDLEPKSLHRIPKQMQDDTDMINNFSMDLNWPSTTS